MRLPRKIAVGLLDAAVRRAPESSREWAEATRHELDFVEGDWAALFWALGSLVAIARHAASHWREWLRGRQARRTEMNNGGKKTVGVVVGALSALMLVGCAFAVLRIASILFPGLNLEHSHWAYWLAVLAIPEAIFVVATIVLWRRRGPVAAGILATGLVMALHVAVHFAMR